MIKNTLLVIIFALGFINPVFGGGDAGSGASGGKPIPDYLMKTYEADGRNVPSFIPGEIQIIANQGPGKQGDWSIKILVYLDQKYFTWVAFYNSANQEIISDYSYSEKFRVDFVIKLKKNPGGGFYLDATFSRQEGFSGKIVQTENVRYFTPVIVHTPESKEDWRKFAAAVTCRLRTAASTLAKGQSPVFTIDLIYNGEAPVKIDWDEDFGNVIWRGSMAIVSASKGKQLTSSGLGSVTSSTPPSSKFRVLNKGDRINAELDFNKFPASSLKHLFAGPGTFTAGIYASVCLGSNPDAIGELKYDYILLSDEVIIHAK